MIHSPVPKKHSPFVNSYLFRPYDLGQLFEVIEEDGSSTPVLIPGTFIDGLWHDGSPVLDPDRTFEPIEDPEFYCRQGCNPPVEVADTPFAEEFGQ
ncbi:MAG: hypothetical protein ABJN14_08510 [Paracoccaceae bacterium]